MDSMRFFCVSKMPSGAVNRKPYQPVAVFLSPIDAEQNDVGGQQWNGVKCGLLPGALSWCVWIKTALSARLPR
jgi:hypothetical protein